MENVIRFYGLAKVPNSKKTGIVLAVKRPGQRVASEYTGEEFTTQRAAEARMNELNRQLTATDPAWLATFAKHGIESIA